MEEKFWLPEEQKAERNYQRKTKGRFYEWPFLCAFIKANMERLRKNEDFQSVYQSGKSYANKSFVIYVLKNNLGTNRLGVSVSKKIGNSVVRHRMKRLVKENFRLHEDMFNSGLDIAVIVRKNAVDLSFEEVGEAIFHLMKLHHQMKSEQ